VENLFFLNSKTCVYFVHIDQVSIQIFLILYF